VAVEAELQRDPCTSQFAHRRHGVETGNGGEGVFQRDRHGGSHGFGVRAWQIGVDADGREIDVGKFADGKGDVSEHAKDDQRGHQQGRHDGTFDEDPRDIHWASSPASAALAETLTGPLGWTRNWPSTMTESPGLRSPVTAAFVPSSNRTLTFCCVALEFVT